jgi:hypothetical protein
MSKERTSATTEDSRSETSFAFWALLASSIVWVGLITSCDLATLAFWDTVLRF